jgi:hypothetical protein
MARLVSVALLLAFLEAPFEHTHQNQSTQRHSGPPLHLHLKSFHATGSGEALLAPDPDDDAVFQNWFAITHNDPGTSPALAVECFSLSAPEDTGWIARPLPEMGPDPPHLSSTNPRAPPA